MPEGTPTPADMPSKPPTNDQGQSDVDEGATLDSLPKYWQDQIKQARKDAEKYRARAKQAADDEWYERATKAVSELDEVENARKSETQRLTEKLNEHAADATESRRALDRLRAALRAGFAGDEADDIASRLRGGTADELEADARALRERFPPAKSAGLQPDPSQGANALPLNGDPLTQLLRSKLK